MSVPYPDEAPASSRLLSRARAVIPGGVNSPVRAFGSVGGTPRFIRSAQGPWLTDADGRRYVDLVGSWGPMIVGHNHPKVLDAVIETARNGLSFGTPNPLEVTMAETITRLIPSCEMVRMVNSGTEATLSAIRLARGEGAFLYHRGPFYYFVPKSHGIAPLPADLYRIARDGQ